MQVLVDNLTRSFREAMELESPHQRAGSTSVLQRQPPEGHIDAMLDDDLDVSPAPGTQAG